MLLDSFGRYITDRANLLRLYGRPHNRSIKLAPRRYLDEMTGQWKDATSYHPVDLSTLARAVA